MPRSLAICAIGRPDSSTSRTARSRSSSGYFFGAGIAETVPLPRMKSWLRGLRQTRPGSLRLLLPSQAYGFSLVARAVDRGAVIVLMRSRALWLNSVAGLASADVLELKVPRSAYVTAENLSAGGFERSCAAL